MFTLSGVARHFENCTIRKVAYYSGPVDRLHCFVI